MLLFARALSGCAALKPAKLAGNPGFDRSTRVQSSGTASAKPLSASRSTRQPAGTGTGDEPASTVALGIGAADCVGAPSSVLRAATITPTTIITISRIHPARDQLRWRRSNASASRCLEVCHAHSLPLTPA